MNHLISESEPLLVFGAHLVHHTQILKNANTFISQMKINKWG